MTPCLSKSIFNIQHSQNNMKKLDDFRLQIGTKEYAPIMLGGMGVDISTQELALEVARLGGIGHISDAMLPAVTDRLYDTTYSKDKFKKYKVSQDILNKAEVQFDLEKVAEATRMYVAKTMDQKTGDGGVFINCMEKLTMNNPRGTLKARLEAAMDAGIDGISLSAGLHLGSLDLIQDHPRFRDVKIGIIVSSDRALKLFLKRAAKLKRMPDFIVVEGPLAGGHLGFGLDDWKNYDLKTITEEVFALMKKEGLNIPILPAGGIFTGTDAVEFMEIGAAGVQVATRFTVTEECGLPENAIQAYFQSQEKDILVSDISPTGYPFRLLNSSPALGSGIRPNCESYGFLLDKDGNCSYIDAYNKEVEKNLDKISVEAKTCLCTHMRSYKCYVCGHYAYRLKDTTVKNPDGSYQTLTAEHVFNDYLYSTDHQIILPK